MICGLPSTASSRIPPLRLQFTLQVLVHREQLLLTLFLCQSSVDDWRAPRARDSRQ